MKMIRILVATAIIVLVPTLSAAAAHATVDGPCTATATIGQTSYDATQKSVEIPRKGAVAWKGSIPGRGRRVINGKIYLKLPKPFGQIEIGNGSWNGPSSRYKNSGVYVYDFPAAMVGPKYVLFGSHSERGAVVCTGTVEVQITGSKARNPVLIASLVLTFFAILNVGLVLRARPR
jgi:hypothetical protein